MNEQYLRNVIEAALLAAGRPVQPAELIQLFDESARPSGQQIRAAIDMLAAEYAGRGIELKETASGALLARAPRDTRAHRLSSADHPWGDRGCARCRRKSQHREDPPRAQLGTRGRSPRRPRAAGAARHHAGLPRLLRPEESR